MRALSITENPSKSKMSILARQILYWPHHRLKQHTDLRVATLCHHFPYSKTDNHRVKISKTKLVQCSSSRATTQQSSRKAMHLQMSWRKTISTISIGNLHHGSTTITRGHLSKVHRRNCLQLTAQINNWVVVRSSIIQEELQLSKIANKCSETSMSLSIRYPNHISKYNRHRRQNLSINNQSLSGKL